MSTAAGPSGLSAVVHLRAWKLAVAGPSVFWYFPVFYALLSTNTGTSPVGLTVLFVVMAVSASWGFLLNDLADRRSDAASGRADVTHGHGLSQRTMVALVLVTAGVSWALALSIGGDYVFKVILAVNYLVGALYSIPPVKLKVRKFWGFLANTVMERPLPALVLLSYMNYYRAETILLPVLMELTWSVFKHQAADVREDTAAGVHTYAVALGEEMSYRIVNRVLNPLSVAALLTLLLMAAASIPQLRVVLLIAIAFFLVGVAAASLAERKGALGRRATPTDPPYIMFLNFDYRFIVLPVMAWGVLVLAPAFYYLTLLLALTLAYQIPRYYGLARMVVASSAGATSAG